MKTLKVSKRFRIIMAAGLLTVAFALKQTLGYATVTIIFMVLSTLVAGTPVFLKAWGAVRYRIIGIDALVTIAVIGAISIGEFWEAAAVTFLFLLGDYLEARTLEKTRSSLKSLLNLAPLTARVRRGGIDLTISPGEVGRGESVVVKPGEKIAVDGLIDEGAAYVNQAAITGESLPIRREPGERVFSGSIIESGYLVIIAERVGEETMFARILHLVEDAQDKKAKTQKYLEKFARWYTPSIISTAILLFIVTQDIKLSLTLLVISCPGALVISAPVSIVAGIGNGARNGVLVKGGDIMEKLGTVKVVAFDKTGTVTLGRPGVTAVKAWGMAETEILRIAAIGEAYSEHPLAKAIIRAAASVPGEPAEFPGDNEIIKGRGLMFTTGGRRFLLGNRRLFSENMIDFSEQEAYLSQEERQGRTVVMLGEAGAVVGVISIADSVRPEAKRLIADLRNLGIRRVVMLSGDNAQSVGSVAAELGFDDYFAELLPEDKVRVLAGLQAKWGRIAMVGDGVNDAPALASADLGIAVAGAGNDVALETADVVLMAAGVAKLSLAIGLSRRTVRNMKQNIGFALLVAAGLLAGVLVKTVDLSVGMLVHEASVLLVIMNAVRLLAYREPGKKDPKELSYDK